MVFDAFDKHKHQGERIYLLEKSVARSQITALANFLPARNLFGMLELIVVLIGSVLMEELALLVVILVALS